MVNIDWSDAELNVLKNNYKLSTDELIVLLPNRTPHGIMNKAYKMGLTHHNVPKRIESKKHLLPEHRKRLSESIKRWWELNRGSEFVAIRNRKISRIHKGNPNIINISKGIRTGIHKICENCSQTFYVMPSASEKRRFCTRKCFLENLRKMGSPKKGRKSSINFKREDLIKEIGKCNQCGYDDKRILVVHHVDGNHRNNKRENLTLLCPNCHTLNHYEKNGVLKLKGCPNRERLF